MLLENDVDWKERVVLLQRATSSCFVSCFLSVDDFVELLIRVWIACIPFNGRCSTASSTTAAAAVVVVVASISLAVSFFLADACRFTGTVACFLASIRAITASNNERAASTPIGVERAVFASLARANDAEGEAMVIARGEKEEVVVVVVVAPSLEWTLLTSV